MTAIEILLAAAVVRLGLAQQRLAFLQAVIDGPRVHDRQQLPFDDLIPFIHQQLFQPPLLARAHIDLLHGQQLSTGGDHAGQRPPFSRGDVGSQVTLSAAPGPEAHQHETTSCNRQHQCRSQPFGSGPLLWGGDRGTVGLLCGLRVSQGLQHGPTKLHNSLAAGR